MSCDPLEMCRRVAEELLQRRPIEAQGSTTEGCVWQGSSLHFSSARTIHHFRPAASSCIVCCRAVETTSSKPCDTHRPKNTRASLASAFLKCLKLLGLKLHSNRVVPGPPWPRPAAGPRTAAPVAAQSGREVKSMHYFAHSLPLAKAFCTCVIEAKFEPHCGLVMFVGLCRLGLLWQFAQDTLLPLSLLKISDKH